MSDMREAGKKKKLKLNSLTSGIRIKSKNQTRWNWGTKYQFGWHLHSQVLSFVAEAFGFGWQGYVQENSSFGYSLQSLWLSQCTFWLMPSLSGQYFGYSFLKYAQIWKEEARPAHSNACTMRWTTSLTIWSVYLNGNISAFGELFKELNRRDRKEFISYLFSEVNPIHIQEIILATI